jgi:hypothetical protein
MTRFFRSSLILCFLAALACAGCASYPQQELSEAQAAMDQAKEQQAEVFAAANWADAEKAWTEGQSLLTQQKYSLAKTSLMRAKSRFEKAADIAKSKREQVLTDIKNDQHTANTRFAAMKAQFSEARLPASVRKDLEACCQELERQVEQLNSEIMGKDLVKAQATAKETLSKVYEAELKLQAALKKR